MSKRNRKNKNSKNKKAQERLKAQKEKQKKIFFGAVFGIIAAIIIVGVVILNWGNGDDGGIDNDDVNYKPPPVSNSGTIEINKADLSDGGFHYYQYDTGSEQVKYFMVLGSDGEIHSAFDACEVCWREGKGYSRSGNNAMCNNCGNKYPINDLGTKNIGGGCWPGYLPQTVSGDKIVIKTTDLKRGEDLF